MALHRVDTRAPLPLFSAAAARQIEHRARDSLPAHTLMQRAGLSVARLALALAPHARTVWLACGPGNNGGDGLEAAVHLQQAGKSPVVTWLGDPDRVPPDSRASLQRARAAGVVFSGTPPPLAREDLCIDALLGMGGGQRSAEGLLATCIRWLRTANAPVLAVDLPSGLHSDTGHFAIDNEAIEIYFTLARAGFHAQNTLCLLTHKPGLWTGQGRDAAGHLWFDDLGIAVPTQEADAWLGAAPHARPRPHTAHKGSHGDVAVLGGAAGMAGAALLAGSAALHAGAGRVFVGLLDGATRMAADGQHPELMLRTPDTLPLRGATVVCGCGGGEQVAAWIPQVLAAPGPVVLDADALNALARDSALQALLRARGRRGQITVLTPHPLEAARLLGKTTAQVQADRLTAARQLARDSGAIIVLKGSGSIVAAPGMPPTINPTGNARLATAGTGDVLAGLVGAWLHDTTHAAEAAARTSAAVYAHGALADQWPAGTALTAGRLAAALHI